MDKSQELAFALLKEAKEKGILDPSIEAGLAELIGAEGRPQVKGVLEAPAIAEATESEEAREPSPEQADQILDALKTRFEAPENEELRKAIDFADVEKSLRAAPEKLYALHKLEETGGEPQVIGLDGDEFIFEDRSKESPSGRRNLNADQAAAQAEEFGTDMQSPEAYRAMQETGEFDLNSASWLKTSAAHRKKTGHARGGCRDGGVVSVYEGRAESRKPSDGWRASLRVKKVKL